MDDIPIALPVFEKHWNGYCFRIWITRTVRFFAIAGLVLAGAIVFWPKEFSWSVVAYQVGLILIWSIEWGRVHATEAEGIKLLYRKQPKLAEAIQTALDFQSRALASPISVYFQTKHLDDINQQLQAAPLAEAVPLIRSLFYTGTVCIFLGILVVNQPYLPDVSMTGLPSEKAANHLRTYRVLYPVYMQKPPALYTQMPHQLKLPQGSRVEIYFNLSSMSQSVQKKSFYAIHQEHIGLNWLPQKKRWIASISPLQSGTLHLYWDNLNTQHLIEVVPDNPPQLTVIWPQTQLIFSNSKLPIQLSVSDDYGLQQITLHYQVQKRGARQEIIQSFEGKFTKYQETYPWELGSTFLRQGDFVEAWIEVNDNDALNGPNITMSDTFEFTIQNINDYHQNVMERLQYIVQELGQLMWFLDQKSSIEVFEKEQKLLAQLKRLRHDAQHDRLLTKELRHFLFSELQAEILFYQNRRLQLLPPPS
ncbi:MAG: hypothetical protein HQM14_10135 [SAR324 cluster bacterium]|nr:hypothetical protein [SAR324 cluster bacterium]